METPSGTDLPVVPDVLGDPDPVLRNQRVTAGYHALAVALARRASPDVTWCGFAVWASTAAGRMIAMDELPRYFSDELDRSEDYQAGLHQGGAGPDPDDPGTTGLDATTGHATILRCGEHLAAQVAAQVSAGNSLVFAELAPVFLALLAGVEPATGTDPALLDAYARYAAAFASADPVVVAGQVLAANVLAVHHEQRRLQPYIATALDMGLADAAATLHAEVEGDRLLADLAGRLRARRPRAFAAAERAWDTVMTRHCMTLVTPERVFDLGRDVPPLPDGSRGPVVLTTLAAPEPARLVATFDRTDGTLAGSAARDWADLDQRMNYVVNLFRSRQQSATLLQPPGPTTRPRGGSGS